LAATIVTTPTYVVPSRPARAVFTPGFSTVNYVRAWCTQAPAGSALQAKIDANRLNRALVYQDDGGPRRPWRITFDKGGVYSFLVQEYTKGNHWGGGYEGDTRGAPTETKVGTEAALSLYVAQRLTQELGAGPDRATLVTYAHDDRIIGTTVATHGEKTPAIVNPTSDRAAVAAAADDVTTALDSLVDASTALLIGDLGLTVDEFIEEFVDHGGNSGGTWHSAVDTQTDLEENYSGSTSLGGIAKALNKVRTRLGQHMLNSQENVAANPEYALPGGVDIHNHNSTFFDLKNTLLPITADENNPATIFQAIGDYYRAYSAHRIANMHENPDTSNGLSSLGYILEVHRQFATSLADITPTAQPGQSSVAALLIGTAGFKES